MKTIPQRVVCLWLAWFLLSACSSDESDPSAAAGANAGGGPSNAQAGLGGQSAAGSATGGAGGVSPGGSAGSSVNGGAAPDAGFDAQLVATALAANRSVGVEWNVVEGATAYKVYFAEGAAPTGASMSTEVKAPHAGFVHRALTNGTVYQYAVSAIVGGRESKPSPPAMATPGGEWVLEEMGDGQLDDVSTGKLAARVPLAKRIHLLLFAEGYQEADLEVFHDDADHAATRKGDVDAWVDYVFSLAPYKDYREAFVIWQLPRTSITHFDGADTAFMVPVESGQIGSVSGTSEIATRAWAAIALLPVQPTDFTATTFGNGRTHVASFLLYDAARGRAGVSGLTTSLRNPARTSERISAAFGQGHAHEFTHAFSGLRDEYIELDNSPPNASETSNVVASNQCAMLPWQHLLAGGAYNAATESLVGAFGTPEQGYHSELLCLLNGTHDNAQHYGGNGLLRDDDRMCNFCREITAYRIYSRSGVLADDQTGFAAWKSAYRAKFFERYPFAVPATVPQTNNVQNPAQGTPVYEACSATAQLSLVARKLTSPSRQGCIVDQ
jgi:hypothetical protein